MPQLHEQRRAVAEAVRNQLAKPSILTSSQATLFSQAVRLGWGGTGLATWTLERRREQLADARRLLEVAGVLAEVGDIAHARAVWRRAGDLFEWLARSRPEEPQQEERLVPLRLLGAAAYHLAGLPAMAAGLLRTPRHGVAEGALLAAFLRSDFAAVIDTALEYWMAHPSLTRPEAERMVLEEDSEFLASELVRCVGLFAAALRTNRRDRLETAQSKLRALASMAARARSETIWLALELTAQVAAQYAKQSLWAGVEPLEQRLTEVGRSHLAGYVRAMFGVGRGLLWPSQREGIARLVEGGSFAACTPTGSGKTTIAEVALLDALYAAAAPSSPLALYLVPSRALAAEVEARLAHVLRRVDPQLTITGLYGGTEWSLTDAWVTATGPTILVSTVEMAESLLRYLGRLFLSRLALVVVDEAHQVQFADSTQNREYLRVAENRAARLESLVTRLFACAPQCRALGLSAVAGGLENAIARWLSRDPNATAIGSAYRSTRQLIGALECRADGKALVRLERLDGSNLELAGRRGEAYVPVPFQPMPAVTGPFKANMGRFARAHTLWAAMQIVRAGRTVLVSVTRDIDTVAADFRNLLERQHGWQEVDANLTRNASARVYAACLAACEDYCGRASNELFLLRHGIAVHHGQLPVKVRRLMTEVIRAGMAPLAVATSTLTEGVNLPFDVVLVPSLLRSEMTGEDAKGVPQYEWSILSAAEFLNLAGRAGRPGTSGEGMTLVALPVEVTATTSATERLRRQSDVQKHADRFKRLLASIENSATGVAAPSSPLARLISLLRDLWLKTTPAGSEADFLGWLETANQPAVATPPDGPNAELAEAVDSLDLMLLAAISELENLRGTTLAPAELEAHLQRVWSSSFAHFAESETGRMEAIFLRRGRVLPQNIYPDARRRRELYRLGLPPKQGAAFLTLLAEIEARLGGLSNYQRWAAEDRANLFAELAALVQATSAFRFRITKDVDWRAALIWWLQIPGAQPPDAGAVQDWLRTVAANFEYRLGTAIGTALAAIWSRTSGDEIQVLDLDRWHAATGLPWITLWLRELLAWGTTEPLVAFLVATGREASRAQAAARIPEYEAWFQARNPQPGGDEVFHPKAIRRWASQVYPEATTEPSVEIEFPVSIEGNFPPGTTGYPVVAIIRPDIVDWLDPAGYVLAKGEPGSSPASGQRGILYPHTGIVRLAEW